MLCGDGPRCTPHSVIRAVWRSWTPSPGVKPRRASWRQRLGMGTNLLAHHLRVLEDVGLVRRHRSEGDRRRSYVTLVRDLADELHPVVTGLAARAGGVRVHPELGPLPVGGIAVERHQPRPGDLGRNPPRPRGASRRGRGGPPTPSVAGRHPAPTSRRRPRRAGPGRHRVRQRPRRTRHPRRTARAGRARWRALVDPRPGAGRRAAAFDRVVDELTDRIARLAPLVTPSPPPSASGRPAEDRRTS